MELDPRQVVRIARRWWWLLLVGPLVAGALGYLYSSRQPPQYAASATLVINPAQSTGTVDINSLRSSQSLAETYRQLIRTRPVLDGVVQDLKLPYGADALKAKITASAVRDTQLLKVSVSDRDPAAAAAIANAVATRFAKYIADQTVQLSSTSRTALDQQIADTKRQIDATTTQIQTLEQSAAPSDPALQAKLDPLRATLNQLNQSYALLLGTEHTMDLNDAAAKAQVTVWEPAVAPTAPYAPRVELMVLLGVVAGLVIAGGLIAGLEYLDNTVKADEDFLALAGGPLLAAVGSLPKLHGGPDQLFVAARPNSTAAEAIRLLRTNIEFAAAAREITSLAISSPGPGEGKSTVTANLGLALAQAGFNTVIIDADLRRPRQHSIFGARNDRGLTTLLTHPGQDWRSIAVRTEAPNLTLIPSGPLPPNPADLLSLDRLRHLLAQVNASTDIILIDTPPSLAVSDPLVVGTHVDGVILVCLAGRTRRDALHRAAAAFEHGAIRLVGVVVNQETGREAPGYYYSGYGASSSDDRPAASAAPSRDQGAPAIEGLRGGAD